MASFTHLHRSIVQRFFAIQHRREYVELHEH